MNYSTERTNSLFKNLALLLFLITAQGSFAQTQLEIKNAGALKFDESLGDGAKRLIDNVHLQHENILVFCDSAYFYNDNSIDAYGNVNIQQDDSIQLFGDYIHYDGNTKKALVKGNVKLIKGDMHLSTNRLNYNLNKSIGLYNTFGTITNGNNILTSEQGEFYAKQNDLYFKKNVVVTQKVKHEAGPPFIINCDTMRYNTTSKTTYFYGPTTITSDSAFIYCEDGWYNTNTKISRFTQNGYIQTSEHKLIGDSVFYNASTNIGRAIGNVQLIDTTNKTTIKGHYAIHYENDGLSVVTDSVIVIKYFDNDTLYLHSDTLKAINNELTGEQSLLVYNHVKFFKNDVQGKCDSLTYIYKDSALILNDAPVIWTENNQLSADTIKLFLGNSSIKGVNLIDNSFIASEKDSLYFNQIRGKKMDAFFNDTTLYLIKVVGNGQTLYYVENEKTKKVGGVNFIECSNINIYLKNKDISKINFMTKPEAVASPLHQQEVSELKGFNWREKERPKSIEDIFIQND